METDHVTVVRDILSALEASLRRDCPLPTSYASYSATCFDRFIYSEKAWGGTPLTPDVTREFEGLDHSEESEIDRLFGTGKRLSEKRLKRIGRAFCRAFGLAGHATMADPPPSMETWGIPDSPGDCIRIRREPGFSMVSAAEVQEAEAGHPQRLRLVLHRVFVRSSSGEPEIPRSHAFLCADALRTLLNDFEAWERIERRPLSDNDQLNFGRAFCRAFHLSKSQWRPKRGELPKHVLLCPTPVHKLEELILYGVSMRKAKSLVSRAFPRFSSRTLDDWVEFMDIGSNELGIVGECSLVENRLAISVEVQRALTSRRSQKEAYLEVARGLARKLFPSFRSQFEGWAVRILRESKRRHRPTEHVALAQRVALATEQGQPLPSVPKDLVAEILPKIRAEKAATRLPESSVRGLIPAVRTAHKFSLSLAAQ